MRLFIPRTDNLITILMRRDRVDSLPAGVYRVVDPLNTVTEHEGHANSAPTLAQRSSTKQQTRASENKKVRLWSVTMATGH